jgi:Outer membrane efflux protein
LSMPIGFRRELSGVRHHELLIARERAILQDLELEVSHQLGDAIRDVDNYYGISGTNFNRRVASEKEVQAVDAAYQADRVTLDLLLDAQRRRAEAESAYYRSLIDYNKAIMNVHYRKGSLLDYDGVYLAEGPWPGKAYFDALREARKRDASMYLDYGFTRPNVVSQGPYQQLTGEGCKPCGPSDGAQELGPAPVPASGPTEMLPPPASDPSASNNTVNRGASLTAATSASRGGNPFADHSPPVSHERQANYTAAEAATTAPIRQWAER